MCQLTELISKKKEEKRRQEGRKRGQRKESVMIRPIGLSAKFQLGDKKAGLIEEEKDKEKTLIDVSQCPPNIYPLLGLNRVEKSKEELASRIRVVSWESKLNGEEKFVKKQTRSVRRRKRLLIDRIHLYICKIIRTKKKQI